MNREYHGFIFTTHALERLQARSVSQDAIVATLQHPDWTRPEPKANTTKFAKTVDHRAIQVIATWLPDKKQWLIVSVWVRGEEDKEPFSWLLITWPFRVLVWLLKFLAGFISKKYRNYSGL